MSVKSHPPVIQLVTSKQGGYPWYDFAVGKSWHRMVRATEKTWHYPMSLPIIVCNLYNLVEKLGTTTRLLTN